MNILIVSHEYPPVGGGGANACKHLARHYAKKGHKVTIVTVAYQDTPDDECVDGVRIVRLHAKRAKVDTSSFKEMFSYLVRAYIYTDKLCKQEKFDVCQVFFGIPSGPIALHLKRKYHIPYVVRFGGGDIPGAQKRFGIVYKILSPIIRSIWKNANALVANSEVLRSKALSYENRYEVKIIPNGVDSGYYFRKTVYNVAEDIKMVFVSRLIEGKGLQYIIPRMTEIADRVGKRISLTIVGDGPYKNDLEALIDENNREMVDFVGRKTGEDLLKCYDDANIFILPSLSEGMPNVVLEAMSMGLPIAMTDCGGSKELIDGNGIVAKIEDFVDRLVDLLKDSDKMCTYSNESRKRVEELFGWDAKADEYIKLFEG